MGKPSHEALVEAIEAMSGDWIAAGLVTDVRSIGDGLCYEFAMAVMDRPGVDGHGAGHGLDDSRRRLVDLVTEDWWSRVLDDDGRDAGEAECFHMDIARLRREGAPLPTGIDDAELATLLGAMTHSWLALDGRHYDAGCPEGADHFLLMPFFADQIAAHAAGMRQRS